MPQGPAGPRPKRDARRGRFIPKRKVCAFCADKVRVIDYTDVSKLRHYVNDRAKIDTRRRTGTCAKHQRALTIAIKRARQLALLPYTPQHLHGSLPVPRP